MFKKQRTRQRVGRDKGINNKLEIAWQKKRPKMAQLRTDDRQNSAVSQRYRLVSLRGACSSKYKWRGSNIGTSAAMPVCVENSSGQATRGQGPSLVLARTRPFLEKHRSSCRELLELHIRSMKKRTQGGEKQERERQEERGKMATFL